MTTTPSPPRRPFDRRDWPRQFGWIVVWLAAAAISADFLVAAYGRYHVPGSDAYAMFVARRGWLWTHLAGGAITVVLGPLQFVSRWPRRYPRWHRAMGRVYFGAMGVALVGAIGLIATSPAPMSIRVAFAATALAWASTGLLGLVAIRRRREAAHRRFMIRNYLVTLAPVTFRLMLPGAIAFGAMPTPALIALLLWLSWSVPLVIAEAVFRVVDRHRSHRLGSAGVGIANG